MAVDANLIRESKTLQIAAVMQTGRQHGMISFEASVQDLIQRDRFRTRKASPSCTANRRKQESAEHVRYWTGNSSSAKRRVAADGVVIQLPAPASPLRAATKS